MGYDGFYGQFCNLTVKLDACLIFIFLKMELPILKKLTYKIQYYLPHSMSEGHGVILNRIIDNKKYHTRKNTHQHYQKVNQPMDFSGSIFF